MREKQRQFNNWENGPDFDRARTQIATPFQYVDIALDVATVNAIFNISGDFLYIDASSTGSVTLELNNQYNDASAPFYASPGFGLNALFKQVKLSWVAQAGKKVRIMYSTGDKVVPTNSTTVNGYVSTVDGGLSRTLQGIAFICSAGSVAVAGMYSHGQLWNPPGSTKNLYLERVSISSGAPVEVFFGRSVAALGGAGSPVMNKYLSSGAGVGVMRVDAAATQLYAQNALHYWVAGNSTVDIDFREPILIPPGNGAVIFASAVNVALLGNFEWYEQ